MTAPALRSMEFWAANYRRVWHGTIVSSLGAPVLYLAAMGLGLGGYVHGHGRASLGHVDYLTYLAPGLLAATAMQVATGESTWPVIAAIKWDRIYHAMLATPLRIVDVLTGHLGWIAIRVTVAATAFLAVMAMFGTTQSWLAILALPAAVLTGMAFAAPIVAYAATLERETSFSILNRFVVIPLFLFSGTFFPISQLPSALRPVAYATPLWHGVVLCRGLVLGRLTAAGTVVHIGYLLVLLVAGVLVARVTYRRRLSV